MRSDNDGGNNVVTMPMTNYERQKRWREKHRGLANLRRREHYRRSNGDSVEQPEVKPTVAVIAPKTKIEELRALMAAESAKPALTVAIEESKPTVFKNDFGVVITEAAWNELQKRKAKATEGGYVLDEFSQ